MWHNEGASCHGNKPLSGMWPSRAHTPREGKGRRCARWSGVLRRDHEGGHTNCVALERKPEAVQSHQRGE